MLWHEHLKRAIKLLAVGSLHYTGMLGVKRRRAMRDQALILMYHRVNPPGFGAPDYSPVGMSVTPDEFAMQMRFVRRNYDVVPLSRIVAALEGKAEFTPNMCAVTFDDGWQDVYEFAFPIMRELGIPATIYLTSGFIDERRWFWEERIKYLLSLVHREARRGKQDASVSATLAQHDLAGMLDLPPARLNYWLLAVCKRLKPLDDARRTELMNSLEELARRVAPQILRPFMNWAEVREMAAAGIEFGNHTENHPILPELADVDLEREVRGAARTIEESLGKAPADFAYPYGKFDQRVLEQVRATGARSATTTRFGLVDRAADRYALNRINMCSDIAAFEPLFAARILGI